MRIDCFVSQPHYADHLLPIWQALPDEHRGSFYAAGRHGAHHRARTLGVNATQVRRGPPQDGQPILVAGYADEIQCHGHPIAFLEHGAGQHYGGHDPNYSGGVGRGSVGLFICPNETVADRNRNVYPNARFAVVGCPKLDPWHTGERGAPDGTIGLAWHWDHTGYPESRSAFQHYRNVLVELARAFPGRLLGHGHPRTLGALSNDYRKAGIPISVHLDEVFDRASILIADNTSAMYEFASLGRPVVVLNAPWYRRDVEHGLRFWSDHRLGPVVDHRSQLVGTVAELVAGRGDDPAERRRIVDRVYAVRDGTASERAVAAIVDWLNSGPVPQSRVRPNGRG